jgi:tetratricopeptide (TPR) repeat protein
MLERKNCVDSPLFFAATESLHKIQPNAKSAYLMGALSRQKEQLSNAISYLNEAVELTEDKDDKIKALNLLAAVYYEQRNYSQARSSALKIIQLDPNYGKAYMFIGDLYANSANQCTGDDLGGKTVFWAAVDMYVKAKNADPSIADEANAKISQYSRYYPAATDLFFRDMQEGASYTVGCWINENTTIRGIK